MGGSGGWVVGGWVTGWWVWCAVLRLGGVRRLGFVGGWGVMNGVCLGMGSYGILKFGICFAFQTHVHDLRSGSSAACSRPIFCQARLRSEGYVWLCAKNNLPMSGNRKGP